MKRSKSILTCMLCISVVLGGCSSKEEEEVAEEKGVAVEVANAEKGLIETDYVYSGKIAPVNEVNVFPLATGKVANVNCKIGDFVNAGDVLFTVDTESLLISKKQLQASLEAANAGIAQAEIGVSSVDGAQYQMGVENLRAGVENAKVAYENTKTTYENSKVLYEQGIISKSEIDQIELGYTQAKNAYESAKLSYDLTTGSMLKENKEKASSALSAAQAQKKAIVAQLESIEKSLNDSVVTSPISGQVTTCNVTAGEMLSTSAIPMAVTDTSTLKIDVNVSQRIINTVSIGDEVSIKSENLENPIKAKVKTVNPAANTSGTYGVEIELDNTENMLKPGMFAEVTFTNERDAQNIVVDRDVVISKNGETYVFINDNGVASKRLVETGIDDGRSIQIVKGVEVGESLVVKGQSYLSEDDKLNIVNGEDKVEKSNEEKTDTEEPDTKAADSSEKKGE